jgi:hypothetical protein
MLWVQVLGNTNSVGRQIWQIVSVVCCHLYEKYIFERSLETSILTIQSSRNTQFLGDSLAAFTAHHKNVLGAI